ncbi:MAG: response regulator transcription factor [Acetobacteraceae bacterium]
MRVIIADRKPLLRDSLAALIRLGRPGTEVLTSATLAEATASMGLIPRGLLILEGEQAGSGEVLRAVRLIHPGWQLAVLGRLPERTDPARLAIDAHWNDETDSTAMLADIARLMGRPAVGATQPAAPAIAMAPMLPPAEPAARGLTRRQQDVLGLLAEGRSTKEIARSLNLGVGTIKAHLDGLYRTLGVHNRTAAVHLARRMEGANVVRLEPRPAARAALAAVG